MNLILLVLVNASIFSIDGLGQDMSVFRTPFLHVYERARIEFSLKPEYNILNEDDEFRGKFWTNPFNFSFASPVTKGFVLGLGNLQRFDQTFDVYYDRDDLDIYLESEGGIEEIYVNLNNHFGIGEIAFRGSYLFGNTSEIWNYYIGDYYSVDTFLHKYSGKIFCGGIRLKFVSVSYEFLGDIEWEKQNSDTTIDLPSRLSVGLYPEIFDGKVSLLFEHSFMSNDNEDYRSPNRFKISFIKERFAIGYRYNPWYLKDVDEHGLDFSLNVPIQRLGSITLNLGCSLRNKGSLREINISPEIKLTINEIFARRR